MNADCGSFDYEVPATPFGYLEYEGHYMSLADEESSLERVIQMRKDEQIRMEATMNARISELSATISGKRDELSTLLREELAWKESCDAQSRIWEDEIVRMNALAVEVTDTFRKDLEEIHSKILEVLSRSRGLPIERFEKDLKDFIQSHDASYQSFVSLTIFFLFRW